MDDDDSFFKSNQFQRLANVNTIKSIHTLDYDQKLDTEILIDLAEIITKYRGRLVDMPKR